MSSSFTEITNEMMNELSSTAEVIARHIAENNQSCSQHRIYIVGPRAPSHGDASFLSPGSHNLYPETMKQSYIFNGLEKTKLCIHGKVNNVLIRDCDHLEITLLESTISGVTILKSKGVTLNLPIQNTTAIEESSNSVIIGQITNDTLIYVTSSLDVIINGCDLGIHPFIQGIIKAGVFTSTQYTPPQLQTII